MNYKSAYLGMVPLREDAQVLHDEATERLHQLGFVPTPLPDLHLTLQFLGRGVSTETLLELHSYVALRDAELQARGGIWLRMSRIHFWKTAVVAQTLSSLQDAEIRELHDRISYRLLVEGKWKHDGKGLIPHITVARRSRDSFAAPRSHTIRMSATTVRMMELGLYVHAEGTADSKFVRWTPELVLRRDF